HLGNHRRPQGRHAPAPGDHEFTGRDRGGVALGQRGCSCPRVAAVPRTRVDPRRSGRIATRKHRHPPRPLRHPGGTYGTRRAGEHVVRSTHHVPPHRGRVTRRSGPHRRAAPGPVTGLGFRGTARARPRTHHRRHGTTGRGTVRPLR